MQRWLKFAKYLPEFGWTPVIYTPSNPESPSEDESLAKDIPGEAEILQTPIREPYDIYRRMVGVSKDEKINTGFLQESDRPKRTEGFSRWVRGNFFIPDARVWWIKPSVRYLLDYLKEHPVDVIISTGPPHSMHLIAEKVKRKTGIPWLADFRDPWTEIDFYHELHLSRWADRKHHRLEKRVLEGADLVLGAWPAMDDIFRKHARPKKLEVITNGFDADDVNSGQPEMDKQFTIAHVGSFSPARNPVGLWEALAAMKKSIPGFAEDLRLKLAGKTDHSVRSALDSFGLSQHLDQHSYIPHEQISAFQQSSQILLLVANKAATSAQIIPGKVFEYFSAGRPILAICPEDGDLAEMVRKSQTGEVVNHDDAERTRAIIERMYQQYKAGELEVNGKGVEQYSRKALTRRLAGLLEALIT